MTDIQWTDALAERFWSNASKGAGCWLWNAGKFTNGYGQFRVGKRKLRAHRAAFMLAFGDIPQGMCVCHLCDNPICIKPGHLFLGTNADNTADMLAKNRHARVGPVQPGESNPSAKLSWSIVRSVRQERVQGKTLRAIAHQFSISPSQVRNIVNYKCWKEPQ